MRLAILFFFISLTSFSQPTNTFSNYIKSILEDHSKDMKQYPDPPSASDEVIRGMQKEFLDHDSTKYYFDKLSTTKYSGHIDFTNAIAYFKINDLYYTVLSLSVHWNADVRVYSLIELQKLTAKGILINDQKLKTGERRKEFVTAINFLIYILEKTAWSIPGSENSTIHHHYIYQLCNNLDILTGERLVQTNDPYLFNVSRIEQYLPLWKKHIVQ